MSTNADLWRWGFPSSAFVTAWFNAYATGSVTDEQFRRAFSTGAVGVVATGPADGATVLDAVLGTSQAQSADLAGHRSGDDPRSRLMSFCYFPVPGDPVPFVDSAALVQACLDARQAIVLPRMQLLVTWDHNQATVHDFDDDAVSRASHHYARSYTVGDLKSVVLEAVGRVDPDSLHLDTTHRIGFAEWLNRVHATELPHRPDVPDHSSLLQAIRMWRASDLALSTTHARQGLRVQQVDDLSGPSRQALHDLRRVARTVTAALVSPSHRQLQQVLADFRTSQ